MGDSAIHLHPLFPRLAVSSYNAHLPMFIWCRFRHRSFSAPLRNRLQSSYVILCLLCIPRIYKYYIYTDDVCAKCLARLYVATLLLGSSGWLSDLVFCNMISSWPINPQGISSWVSTPTLLTRS